MSAHRPTWMHAGPHECTPAHMDEHWPHEYMQVYMDAHRPTWMNAVPRGWMLAHMSSGRPTRMYAGSYGCTMAHMDACRPAGGMMITAIEWMASSLPHPFSTGLHSLPAREKLQALGGSTPPTTPCLVRDHFLNSCLIAFLLLAWCWAHVPFLTHFWKWIPLLISLP